LQNRLGARRLIIARRNAAGMLPQPAQKCEHILTDQPLCNKNETTRVLLGKLSGNYPSLRRPPFEIYWEA
jgi:hypothetical protein